MTEAEWLTGTDGEQMLRHLRGTISDRKLRLFVVACARTRWDEFPEPVMREAVETAERFVDGQAAEADMERMRRLYYAPWSFDTPPEQRRTLDADMNWFRLHALAFTTVYLPPRLAQMSGTAWLPAAQLTAAVRPGLLREIIGNPFRTVPFDPSWRTPTVLALADTAYADRAFDRLPILADALEEAGCDAAELLAHLRGPGPHVRGCWALDLVLGRV